MWLCCSYTQAFHMLVWIHIAKLSSLDQLCIGKCSLSTVHRVKCASLDTLQICKCVTLDK